MAAVMIGVDPHKGSHTAVAIGAAEEPLGELRVRASAAQAGAAGGVGGGLAGADLGGRGRRRAGPPAGPAAGRRRRAGAGRAAQAGAPGCGCWQAGDTNKNDPNDALSVAVAALRSTACREVAAEDHAAVLKVWSKRHRDLGRHPHPGRLPAARGAVRPGPRRRHQGDLRSSGRQHPGAGHAVRRRRGGPLRARRRVPRGPAPPRRPAARHQEEARRGGQGVRHHASPRSSASARSSPPPSSATSRDVSRFPSRDHFAAYNGTAPVEVSSGNRKIYRLSLRGNRRLNHAIHMAAVTQIRHTHSDGRAYYDKQARRGQDPQRSAPRPSSGGSATPSSPASRPTPGQAAAASAKGPGGQPGNDSVSSAAGSHPEHRLFGQATPGPGTTLRPPAGAQPSGHGTELRRKPEQAS